MRKRTAKPKEPRKLRKATKFGAPTGNASGTSHDRRKASRGLIRKAAA